jgi:hypothetical protein
VAAVALAAAAAVFGRLLVNQGLGEWVQQVCNAVYSCFLLALPVHLLLLLLLFSVLLGQPTTSYLARCHMLVSNSASLLLCRIADAGVPAAAAVAAAAVAAWQGGQRLTRQGKHFEMNPAFSYAI